MTTANLKVGFTGTREGMSVAQYHAVCDWFNYPRDGSGPQTPTEVHHGACVGADAEFQKLLIRNRIGESDRRAWVFIHAHLSDLDGMTDRHTPPLADKVHKAKPPLDRNRDIVDACDVLIACPKGPEEQRSGTWSTVRYARKQGKRVVVVWRDGKVTEENAASA